MYYSSEDDLIRCKGVVENLLNKRNIDYTDEQLTEITKDIIGGYLIAMVAIIVMI